MVNFTHRVGWHWHEARRLVDAGAIGEVRYVRAKYVQAWLAADYWGNWMEEKWLWRLQSAKGSTGVLGDIGCHIIDFVTGIVGPAERLRCSLHTHPKISPAGRRTTKVKGVALDANDTASIELDLLNGAFASVQASRWATGRANEVQAEISGTEGAILVGHGGPAYLQTCLGKDRHSNTWKEVKLRNSPSNYQRFITAIKKGVVEQPDITRGAEIQSYLDACFRADAEQRAVKVKSWG